MNQELNIHDITRYLGCGLKVKLNDEYFRHSRRPLYRDKREHDALVITNIEIQYKDVYLGLSHERLEFTEEVHIRNVIPVLRPICDLVKPMTHPEINYGKEFIPIIQYLVECGRWTDDIKDDISHVDFTFISKSWGGDSMFRITAKHKDDMDIIVCDINATTLDIIGGNIYYPGITPFREWSWFLDKLHFDYNELIDRKLAININETLQIKYV